MIKKHWPLTDNYGDLINFVANRIREPITKQYLNSCPKSATYLRNTTAESLLDTMNFYYESENVNEYVTLSSFAFMLTKLGTRLTECFAVFLTYYSVSYRWVKTCFLGIGSRESWYTFNFQWSYLVVQKQSLADVLHSRCSRILRHNHNKTLLLEYLFNKAASFRACNFIEKRPNTGASCKYCDIYKNNLFYRIPPVAASGCSKTSTLTANF